MNCIASHSIRGAASPLRRATGRDSKVFSWTARNKASKRLDALGYQLRPTPLSGVLIRSTASGGRAMSGVVKSMC